ncbi:MAG: NAD-binding protein [Candidatus Eremiobacteraeota bacterium]|nr:NAD-binding protein [Candidatus Eremiobacteraeota bacterium]
MRVILVGGGEVVYFLARTFLSKGYFVSIINDSQEESEMLAKRLNALIICGDGSDPNFLEDAKARESKIFIAVTPYDHINMVCCQTASLKFKIPRTMALVNDPDNYEVFKELGIDHVFNQTELIVSMIEKQVKYEHITNLLDDEEGGVLISEIHMTTKMPALGEKLGDINLPDEVSIIGVTRKKKFELKRDSMTLEVGDRILILTNPENLAVSLRAICGEEA